jgi:Xaa-Pro aminopeptidase
MVGEGTRDSSEPVSEARLIIAASEADANLYYATRFLAPDPFIFVWQGPEKILLMSDLEVDRARVQAAVHAVLPLREYEARAKQAGIDRPEMLDALVELLKERRIQQLQVPGSFPAEYADGLRQRGLHLTVKRGPFFEERLVKSEIEVNWIADALRRTETAVGAAVGVIRQADVRDGVLWWQGAVLTAEILRRFIVGRLLDDGLLAMHTIVACGEAACDPHNEGSGPLRAEQAIILDVFPRDMTTQYFADITRTVVKGRAPEALRKMYEAVEAAQVCAMGLIRNGAWADAVHREVQHSLEQCGFRTGQVDGRMQGFFHGTGHGLGLEIHELPRVSKVATCLRTGNVVTVEPGLYYLGVGGVRLEDVVVVTETGCRNLTTYPKMLEV